MTEAAGSLKISSKKKNDTKQNTTQKQFVYNILRLIHYVNI